MGGLFSDNDSAVGQVDGQVGDTGTPTNVTTENSPGGLFNEGGAVSGGTNTTVQAADAVDAAENSRGWAVGDTDTPLDGWSDTNNSKYYSEQSSTSATASASSAAQALNSATVAATAANNASTSATTATGQATAAAASAVKADSDARVADREAALAATSATEAATSATEAATSATEAAASATEAASAVTQVKLDSDEVQVNLALVKADSEAVSDLRAEVKGDSENLADLERRIQEDSELVDSDRHRAELEADVAEAYSRGQGPLASYWVSTDTDQGSHTFESGHDPDGSRTIFDLAGLGSDRGINITGHTFAVYQDFVLQAANTYTISDGVSGAIDDAFITFSTAPATGTRLDVFLLPPGNRTYGPHDHPYISSEQSAIWLAETSQNNVIASTVHDTDITIVAGSGLSGGGTFTTNQSDSENITLNLDNDVIVNADTEGNTLTLTKNDGSTVTFTTADAGSSTFLEDSDTPNSYVDQNGNYPRVNSDTDALEFFNPFPVTNNRLTVLNGLAIRRFEDNAIVFATFEPTGLSVEADPANFVNWDAPITGFTFRGTNDPLVQDTHLTSITNYTVNSTARTISTNYSAYSATERTWVDTADYVDPNNWDGGQVSYTVAGTINDSAGGTHAQSESFGWNAAGWSSSGGGNIGTLDFDETRSLFTVTGTVRNTSDHNNITSVSTSTDQGVAGTATRNGNDYRATITAINNLYHDSDVSGTWTATFTKPTSVSSASDRAETLTTNWTRSYTTGYKTWAILNSSSTPAESLLGTLSASGYSATETRSGDTSTSTWRGRTYTFNNSAGSTSMTGYLIAPSSIDPTTSFTNPDVQNAVYSGVTRTEINLGQAGHQVAYYFYTFTVGAGNTIRVTVA